MRTRYQRLPIARENAAEHYGAEEPLGWVEQNELMSQASADPRNFSVCIQAFVTAAYVSKFFHVVQEDDVERYGEGEPGVRERELRQPPHLDPDSALEQLMRSEGRPEHSVPSINGRCVRRCMCTCATHACRANCGWLNCLL